MQIFIGVLITFLPFIFFILLSRKFKLIEEIEKITKIPDSISLSKTVDENYLILKEHFIQNHNLIEHDIAKYCDIFKSVQRCVLIYKFSGIIQFIGLLAYITYNSYNTDMHKIIENPDITIILVFIPLAIFITFWMFYGRQILNYMGFNRTKKVIDNAIVTLFELQRKLENKVITFILSSIYFSVLIIYLKHFTPLIKSICMDDKGFLLIMTCIIIFVFYFVAPKIFCFICSIMPSKHLKKINKETLFKKLKNTTYFHLCIIYFIGILINQENNVLLNAITILFMYDTYSQNKEVLIN